MGNERRAAFELEPPSVACNFDVNTAALVRPDLGVNFLSDERTSDRLDGKGADSVR